MNLTVPKNEVKTTHTLKIRGYCPYFLEYAVHFMYLVVTNYRGADKSLDRPGWKKQLNGRVFSSDAEVIAAT